jgi:hypothetical protein
MVKRADAIMVTGGHIFVIEYKVGARLRKARNSAALELLAGPSCQRRTKNQPIGGAKVGQSGGAFSDGGDVMSALARALTT